MSTVRDSVLFSLGHFARMFYVAHHVKPKHVDPLLFGAGLLVLGGAVAKDTRS